MERRHLNRARVVSIACLSSQKRRLGEEANRKQGRETAFVVQVFCVGGLTLGRSFLV